MLEESYCSLELATKLKEKGMPQELDSYWAYTARPCYSSSDYSPKYEQGVLVCRDEGFSKDDIIIAPNISLVQQWFIDEWNIHILPECETDVDSYGNVLGFHYDCVIKDINLAEQISDTYYVEHFKTYDEALVAGIEKALTWI